MHEYSSLFFRDTITELAASAWRYLNGLGLEHETYLVLAEGWGQVCAHETSWRAVGRERGVVDRAYNTRLLSVYQPR